MHRMLSLSCRSLHFHLLFVHCSNREVLIDLVFSVHFNSSHMAWVCVRKPGLDVVQLVCVCSKVGGCVFSGVACITVCGPGDGDAADGGRTSFWGLVDNSFLSRPWPDFQFKRWGFRALCRQSSSILARSALDRWSENKKDKLNGVRSSPDKTN